MGGTPCRGRLHTETGRLLESGPTDEAVNQKLAKLRRVKMIHSTIVKVLIFNYKNTCSSNAFKVSSMLGNS